MLAKFLHFRILLEFLRRLMHAALRLLPAATLRRLQNAILRKRLDLRRTVLIMHAPACPIRRCGEYARRAAKHGIMSHF